MTATLSPAAGMRLFYLDDSGVLFSQATQELHLLNPTAAVIWSLLEEGRDESALAAALRETYAVDERRSREIVADALAQWREKGFLGESASAAPGIAENRPATKPSAAPPWSPPDDGEERRYRILGLDFLVRFSSEAQARVVRPVLEHLEMSGEAFAVAPTRIDVIEAPDRLRVYRDRDFVAACGGVDGLAPIVKSVVWMTVLRDRRYFLNIHAGVVSDGARCVLLPAPPGSGKSTLTAALVHAGFEFFSDEVALLEDRTLAVFPVPLAICVKESGIDALADRYPRLRELALHHRGDGKRVAYMSPPAHRRHSSEQARPVAALVFPRFVAGAGLSLAPLPRFEALQKLMGECLTVSEPLEVPRVEALVQWIARIPCHALRYGSLDDAVAAVVSVFPVAAAVGATP